jgi:hypothetical protein
VVGDAFAAVVVKGTFDLAGDGLRDHLRCFDVRSAFIGGG